MRVLEGAKSYWIALALSAWAVIAFARSAPSYVKDIWGAIKALAAL